MRVVPFFGERVARRVGELQRQLPFGQHAAESFHVQVDDGADVIAGEGVEDDQLVHAVQELGPEVPAHRLHHAALHLGPHPRGVLAALPHAELQDPLRSEVRGHDHQRVLEVDGAPLAVGQAAVVEDLEQHVERLGMRLLDFVEQHHRVGTAAHGFGQRPTLLVADVSGGGADQPRHAVLLLVLRHVHPHHGALVVEQELGQGAGQLGLADSGRPEEQERADRAPGVLQPGARAPHRVGHQPDRLLLAHDPAMKAVLHLHQLLDLPL